MKVFISWSGERSRPLAESLRSWLPRMLQGIDPFVSSADAVKGGRWAPTLAGELEATRIGIVCLTPENVAAPWIHFEAGALSKAVGEAKLCPLLFGMEPTDVIGPLAQFQCATFGKDEIQRVVRMMNDEAGDRKVADPAVFADSFDKWWPDLEQRISSALAESPPTGTAPRRDSKDVLDEILSLVRGLARERDVGWQIFTQRAYDLFENLSVLNRESTLGDVVNAMRQGGLTPSHFATDQTPGTPPPKGPDWITKP